MIKKALLVFLIIIIGYGMLVFRAPEAADNIEKTLGIYGLNDGIRALLDTVNQSASNLPSSEEVSNFIEEGKQNIDTLKGQISNGIKTTKDSIDTVRSGVNDVKETVGEIGDFVDTATEKLDKAKDTLENINKLKDQAGNIFGTGSIN